MTPIVKLRVLAIAQLVIVLLYLFDPENVHRPLSLRVVIQVLVLVFPLLVIVITAWLRQDAFAFSYTLGLTSILAPLALLGAFGMFIMPPTGQPLTALLILITPVLQFTMLSTAWQQFKIVRSNTLKVGLGLGAAFVSLIIFLNYGMK